MDAARIAELRIELEAERISIGELIEIQGEFEKMPSDMLDEIEARL